MPASSGPPDFNRIAHAYRWLEYLTLGPLLNRTRNQFLPRLNYVRSVLIFGDGDGRFTTRLLATAGAARVTAVDTSQSMLSLLNRRAQPFSKRLSTHLADARTFTPLEPVDLIVSHFFFDCLSQADVNDLVARTAQHLRPRAYWLVSEFRIPAGLMRWPARLLVSFLYFAFRVLTGLRITHLPDHATPLRAAGFIPVALHRRLFGILSAELWKHP